MAGMNGFSGAWAAPSAADSVMVMMEVGCREPQQTQDEELARPPGEQMLEHGDRAFAVWALARDPTVHRQRAEERDQHQDKRGDGRQHTGGEGGDARLITESREVVDASQAHDRHHECWWWRASRACW